MQQIANETNLFFVDVTMRVCECGTMFLMKSNSHIVAIQPSDVKDFVILLSNHSTTSTIY